MELALYYNINKFILQLSYYFTSCMIEKMTFFSKTKTFIRRLQLIFNVENVRLYKIILKSTYHTIIIMVFP